MPLIIDDDSNADDIGSVDGEVVDDVLYRPDIEPSVSQPHGNYHFISANNAHGVNNGAPQIQPVSPWTSDQVLESEYVHGGSTVCDLSYAIVGFLPRVYRINGYV